MLKVVEEVYDGGKTFIPNWSLLRHAQESLRRGGPQGLKRYYRRCIKSRKSAAIRVRQTLESNGQKTLESEHARFLAIYRSYYPVPVRGMVVLMAVALFIVVVWFLKK